MRRLPIACVLFLVGCSGGGEEPAPAAAPTPERRAERAPRPGAARAAADAPPAEPRPIDPATAGAVRGVVRFEGEPPRRRKLAVGADAACAALHDEPVLDERVVVTDGRLADVLVRVRAGLDGWIPPAPAAEEVVLDQEGCVYRPHVVGLVAGAQRLVVRNADPTAHNVHVRAPRNGANKNVTQAPGSPPLAIELARRELGIEVSCDIHPWMGAVVHALEDPFFAVSAADGTFAIEGLPPGRYELEARHEELGEQRAEVEVPASGVAEVTITFR